MKGGGNKLYQLHSCLTQLDIFIFCEKQQALFFSFFFCIEDLVGEGRKSRARTHIHRKGNIPFYPPGCTESKRYCTQRGGTMCKAGYNLALQYCHLSLFLRWQMLQTTGSSLSLSFSLLFFLNTSEVTNCKRKRPYAVALSPRDVCHARAPHNGRERERCRFLGERMNIIRCWVGGCSDFDRPG